MRASTKACGTCWVGNTQSSFIPSALIKCPAIVSFDSGIKHLHVRNLALYNAYIILYLIPYWGSGGLGVGGNVSVEKERLSGGYRNVSKIALCWPLCQASL